jgi:predicted transglutaminase-like cysteine proteinase
MGLRRVYAMALGLACLLAAAPSETTSADHAPWVPDGPAFGASIGLALALPAAFDVTAALAIPDDIALPDIALTPQPPAVTAHKNPYGLETDQAPPGALWTKWRKASADIDTAASALMRCKRDFRRCSTAARNFVAIVRQAARAEGRDRLAIVNRGVNKAIAYTADRDQWRTDDAWSVPLDAGKAGSFNTGKGDCEDYAIAKYVALRQAGVADADLQVLMVKDNVAGNHHAVLAARDGGQWLLLDNRWSRLLEESETGFFTPLFALNDTGVMRFGRGDEPVAGIRLREHLARYAANRP